MVTPRFIELIFWLTTTSVGVAGLNAMFNDSLAGGLVVLLFGPLIVRIICELTIVLFRINETLTELSNKPLSVSAQ